MKANDTAKQYEIALKLRRWVCSKNPKFTVEDIQRETPIIEQRIINSLQIMDLILYIEHLNGQPIDVSQIQGGAFSTIDNIIEAFFSKESSTCA